MAGERGHPLPLRQHFTAAAAAAALPPAAPPQQQLLRPGTCSSSPSSHGPFPQPCDSYQRLLQTPPRTPTVESGSILGTPQGGGGGGAQQASALPPPTPRTAAAAAAAAAAATAVALPPSSCSPARALLDDRRGLPSCSGPLRRPSALHGPQGALPQEGRRGGQDHLQAAPGAEAAAAGSGGGGGGRGGGGGGRGGPRRKLEAFFFFPSPARPG